MAEKREKTIKIDNGRIALYTLISSIIIPFVLLVTIPILIFRKLCLIWVKYCYWDKENIVKVVNTTSQVIVYDFFKTNPRFNLVYCWIGEGEMSIESLREIACTKVIQKKTRRKDTHKFEVEYPETSSNIVSIGGYYFWKKIQNFDIKYYVKSVDWKLFNSGSKNIVDQNDVITSENLKSFCAYLLSKKWDPKKSPWEFWLINNYVDEENPDSKKAVVIIRTHHFLADGYSFMNLIKNMFDGNFTFVANPNSSFRRKSNESFLRKTQILKKMLIPLLFPYQLALMMIEFSKRETHEWVVPPGKMNCVGEKYCQNWSSPIPVETIKAIKSKFGTSFASVISSIAASVVQKLMKNMKQNFPETVTAVAAIPMPGHPGGLVNYFGYLYVNLPVGESDPVRRLKLIGEEFTRLEKSTLPFTSYIMYYLIGLYPRPLTTFTANMEAGFSMTLSSFPGFGGDIYFGNCKEVGGLYTLGTGVGGTGATITTFTCMDQIVMALSLDKQVCTSEADKALQTLDDCIQSEINYLLCVIRVE